MADEIKSEAEQWARKLVKIDNSLPSDLLNQLQYTVNVAPDNQVLPKSRGYPIGEGTVIFVDEAPESSRFSTKRRLACRF